MAERPADPCLWRAATAEARPPGAGDRIPAVALCAGRRRHPIRSAKKSAVVTQQPVDGLVVDKDKQDCIASAQGPVRESMLKSEAWDNGDNDGRNMACRVRDGER
jgi:hypothetical protein